MFTLFANAQGIRCVINERITMEFLKNILPQMIEYKRLLNHINKKYLPVGVTGISAVHKAHLIFSLRKNENKKAFVIAANEPEANKLLIDLKAMGCKAYLYPARDYMFREVEAQSLEYVQQRLEVLGRIVADDFDVVIFCIDAGMQYTMPKSMLLSNLFTLKVNDEVQIENLVLDLVQLGYERTNRVESLGQFSVRGDIVDIFTPGMDDPIRIEFWDDTIDVISKFNVETQLRNEQVKCVKILPAMEIICKDDQKLADDIEHLANNLKGKAAIKAVNILLNQAQHFRDGTFISSKDKFMPLVYEKAETIFDYMDQDTLLFLSEAVKVKDRMTSTLWQWREDLKELLESGDLCKGLDNFWIDELCVEDCLRKKGLIYLDVFVHQSYSLSVKDIVSFTAAQLSHWNGNMSLLVEELRTLDFSKSKCVLLAGTEKTAKFVAEDLQKQQIPARFCTDTQDIPVGIVLVMPGSLSFGFEYPLINTKVISHGNIFRAKSKQTHKMKDTRSICSLSELNVGDYVVHSSHGIGVFKGIKKLDVNGVIKDYITLMYDKSDTLYVPVTQLDLVAKYIGSYENKNVKLNKLGTNDWKKTKSRVRTSVKDIADHLIKLYQKRMQTKGYCFSADNEWQRDFERHFEYEETRDQITCIDQIKHDMESDVPMDRLLCGDVGFGKTEVALRAAFKCVCDSKQCAMLVPTTILAWQHYQTVVKRFEGFPVKVELLSRFRTAKQQKEILSRVAKGDVDMVIGTHRLVQNDVKFRDLGLVIVDEEQRFGVKQKEHFKEQFANVDVLTLSATPIPRTLNMAMSGVRDMSMLEEAPSDRQPIQTYVLEYNPVIIKDAILKELRREGQVYYLYNKVETIEQVAGRLRRDLPDAKIAVAHGRMDENKLASIWKQVIEHEIDILVCTTIIETGVDIPNVNTLIIEDADRMGLAQLHQIRGRVGRSMRRAYAYFTFRKGKMLSDISQRRLSAIKEFTEFGSGFKIALRDLELRGAGNILGGQQHGYMADVGYEMYIKLLNDAVSEVKGEKKTDETENECLVDVQVSAYIPDWYIENVSDRIEMYRHIADIKSEDDASDVMDEMIDRFGDVPKSVLGLVDVALIRSCARDKNIYEIKQNGNLIFLYQDKIDLEFVSAIMKKVQYKILVNASSKSYISVECDGKYDTVEVLRDLFT